MMVIWITFIERIEQYLNQIRFTKLIDQEKKSIDKLSIVEELVIILTSWVVGSLN